jgi:fatty acid desaturase
MGSDQITDDLSANFNDIAMRLQHPSGQSYRDFRKSLKPKYATVWRDILLGHAGLAATAAVLVWSPWTGWIGAIAATFVAAMIFGYIHQYLSLFMHEAAHFNIATTRPANDRLANIFLGVIQGYSIQAYRPKHFGHHRELGQPEDPEHHYFHALNWRFFLLTLSGFFTMAEIVRRLPGRSPAAAPKAADAPAAANWVMATGALLHAGIVLGSFWAGRWELAVAWTVGFLIWFPFFSMLRQILEHRDFEASHETDFTQVRHGAITRIFGDGPVANTLGGAGFNRHLLHHWEPLVSYTRLPDLENFLMQTEAEPLMRARHDTYFGSFGKLLRSRAH